MLKYVIISEITEVPGNTRPSEIFNAFIENGVKNGNYTILGEYEDLDKAKEALASHKTTYTTNSYVTKTTQANVVYLEEQELEDEDEEERESTGNYWPADVE